MFVLIVFRYHQQFAGRVYLAKTSFNKPSCFLQAVHVSNSLYESTNFSIVNALKFLAVNYSGMTTCRTGRTGPHRLALAPILTTSTRKRGAGVSNYSIST